MSLKKDLVCPHCEHKVVLRVDKVKRAKRDALPVLVDDDWMGGTVGHFEAFICKSCGFTELYAKDIEEIVRSNQYYGVEVLDGRKGPGRTR